MTVLLIPKRTVVIVHISTDSIPVFTVLGIPCPTPYSPKLSINRIQTGVGSSKLAPKAKHSSAAEIFLSFQIFLPVDISSGFKPFITKIL